MTTPQIAENGDGLPDWVLELVARAKEQGQLWDADILERQPLLINTPSLDRWIERFGELGITVRLSVVQAADDVRRRWILTRRSELDHQLTHYKNRFLLEGADISLGDLVTAEHRLDDGNFGRCVWCEEWLEREVLETIPEKLYCSLECTVLSREDAQRQDEQHRGDVIVSPPSSRILAHLRDLSGYPPGEWPIVLSCNLRRKCWPARIGRFTPDDRRQYIDGKNEFLDTVVRLVLKRRYYGGQFALHPDRVTWAASGETFHSF
jgi:hypothetical protein